MARALHDREAETADLNTTKANVEAQLESTKAKERVLEEDLRNMTRYAGRREVSVRHRCPHASPPIDTPPPC